MEGLVRSWPATRESKGIEEQLSSSSNPDGRLLVPGLLQTEAGTSIACGKDDIATYEGGAREKRGEY